MKLNAVFLGKIEYAKALNIQEKLLALRQHDEIGDVLLLLEHSPVLTVGRSGSYSNILLPRNELEGEGIRIFEVNRGGDVTYHGPGQIVGYPILDLSKMGKDLKGFVWKIEEVFIRLLGNEFNIAASREEGKYTGVWVGSEKITAIGIAVKHWVSMHGFAFNVNTNLDHFKWINPCGITDKGVTSLKKLKGHAQDFTKLNELVLKYFCEVFNLEYEIIDISQIIDL